MAHSRCSHAVSLTGGVAGGVGERALLGKGGGGGRTGGWRQLPGWCLLGRVAECDPVDQPLEGG